MASRIVHAASVFVSHCRHGVTHSSMSAVVCEHFH